MNIREIAGFDAKYYEINREERNYAAIFFAALCKKENIERFLDYCGFEPQIGDDFGIYFEYAYLRDIWYKVKEEKVKKEIIRKKLAIAGIDEIMSLQNVEINTRFGVAGAVSKEYVQFPGKWSIKKYHSNFPDNVDFLKICRFKWSFNIKPDIVIQTNKDRAICIEAKYESGQGFYPTSDIEKKIFQDRGLDYVGQTDLQQYMMERLLGLKSKFIFLVYKKEKSQTHQILSWREAFDILDTKEMPHFAQEMINRISG